MLQTLTTLVASTTKAAAAPPPTATSASASMLTTENWICMGTILGAMATTIVMTAV